MKNYLIVCSFIPVVAFTLTSQLKGDVDLLGLTLVTGLSALLLAIVIFPEEIARWRTERALKKYHQQAQLYATTITPWRNPVQRRPLTPEQRRRAKAELAKSRGIGPESITDESVDLAIANNNILLSGIFTDGPNSYSSPLDSGSSPSCDTGSSSSFDSGSSSSGGGGCD